jgi:hypothetical protein
MLKKTFTIYKIKVEKNMGNNKLLTVIKLDKIA